MSDQAEPPEQEDLDQFFTVFEGSSPENVSHARQLWRSLSLLPPLESRLVSTHIRQRLPVSGPPRSSASAVAGPQPPAPELTSLPDLRQRQEERRRYMAMADQRKEILALLRRQREQRIQKELLSRACKREGKVGKEKKVEEEDSEMDKELVRELQ
ncbi:cilia- and flagella-associated protein HOATZ [Pholidichthys leucotaenia]